MPAKKIKYYAYFVPGSGEPVHGVTDSWAVCEKMVSGKPGARFKAFQNRKEAEEWLAHGARYEAKAAVRHELAPGIYFDAGTGRGEGVEVSVTDELGRNLLHKAISKDELNRFGKHLIANDAATNNYGELLALRYALQVAKKLKKSTGRDAALNHERAQHIFGDSKLVIEYWSQWRIKRNELPEETVALATEVAKLREAFEAAGGTIARVKGDHNPADLGFHR